MTQPALPDAECPWCSASITAETVTCPSCNAILIPEAEHDLPGVTTVDALAILNAQRAPQRNRFLAWLGGEPVDPPATTTEVEAVALPDEAVQREILRLELEAQISNLQAEADSILSDAIVEGRVEELPDGLRPLAAAEAEAGTPAEIADALVAAATDGQADEAVADDIAPADAAVAVSGTAVGDDTAVTDDAAVSDEVIADEQDPAQGH
jgi:hypothetical protein